MTDIRYDIGKIFSAAFGISSPIYITRPIRIGEQNPDISYSGVKMVEKAEAEKMSWLNTPIIFPVKFEAEVYKVYDLKGKLTEKEYADFWLPAATLIEFSRAKNITRTAVLGSNGTVKEIYGFDDWQIRMRGVCLPEPDRTEKDQKEALLAWAEIAASIKVDGDLFFEKGIDRIAISDVQFSQVQAKPEVIPFEITAISDQPIELILANEPKGTVEVDLELIDYYE